MPPVAIDPALCNGCRLCWQTYPNAFGHDGNNIATVVNQTAAAAVANEVIGACPGEDPDSGKKAIYRV
ncbi:ferredoxin [bacterium]|nr:ferredoxin [bacterium]